MMTASIRVAAVHGPRLLALLGGLFFVAPAQSDDGAEFFEKRVRPILTAHCQRCHKTAGKQGGGLALDSSEGLRKGGNTGPVVTPGDPDASLLIQAVRWSGEEIRMPPEDAGGKLDPDQIAALEEWVKRGASWPTTETRFTRTPGGWAEAFEERRQWWSLKPVVRHPAPDVADPDWSGSSVDRFLHQGMASKGVAPAGHASARTLIRRASLVLTGLPPFPDDSDAFERAYRDNPTRAYDALVSRLLASPRFGERFTRHWLDVVRFSETHGNEWNYDVPFAWRYRDYMIRALNQDVPYDQLVREHIAGDLLPHPRWNAEGRFNESVIGTAFYRFGEVNHDSCVEFGVIGYDIVDNQLDTLTKAFQATTVACARCHDHKSDAVSSRDYYALLGILRSTRSVMHTLDATEVNREPTADLRRLKPAIRAELATLWRNDARAIDAAKLTERLKPPDGKPFPATSPAHAWTIVAKAFAEKTETNKPWDDLVSRHREAEAARRDAMGTRFEVLADFREQIEPGWTTMGMGLRDGVGRSGDFMVAPAGDAAIKAVLPGGIFTGALSEKLNGALRSPTFKPGRKKVSFEVIGNGHSFARVVFNNCQLNYTHQHSLHYNDWTWVTIPIDEKTDQLHPYTELATYWDSPKFPDPLGTLGKDTENQRQPFDVHAKDPRTWWGLRRVVRHDGAEAPAADAAFLSRLYEPRPPKSAEEFAARYAGIAMSVVEQFEADRASDEDVAWLRWLLAAGLLTNRAEASPRLDELIHTYRAIESGRISLPRTMPGMADEGEGFTEPLLARGDHTKPSEAVDRGYLRVLDPGTSRASLAGSGRAAVAERVASEENPLTARVIVNRVWGWVFGKGLVRSPDDFGHLGDRPSHPELLDDLSARFMVEGWSIKRLVRELVMTRAFRSDAAPAEGTRERDPENVTLSHYPARRAEAEVIRDAMLAVSGRLDGALYGPSVHPYREKEDTEKRLYAGPLDGDGRRSLYIKFQLMEAPRFLSVFNLPGGKVVEGRRDASNVPAQSLALLNDPFVWAMADHWAGRLVSDGNASIEPRIDGMYRAALGRPARPEEVERFAKFVLDLAAMQGVGANDVVTSRPLWKDAAHAMFNFKEMIFIP